MFLDFEGTLSVLQGFLGREVVVGVGANDPTTTFVAATFEGILQLGSEVDESEVVPFSLGDEEVVLFVVKTGERNAGTFCLWRDRFNYGREQRGRRGGPSVSISLGPLLLTIVAPDEPPVSPR